MKKYIFLIVVVLFMGCSVSSNFPIKTVTKTTSFDSLANTLVDGICTNLHQDDFKKDFYVVDFVNIDNLENRSQLGFVLSSELKSTLLNTCNKITIKEIELGKNIKLGRNGSNILTRELDEIKTKIVDENSNMVIGTYAITTDNLMLFVKVIDLTTGVIKSSTTTTTPLTGEILGLEGYTQKEQERKAHNIYRPLVL